MLSKKAMIIVLSISQWTGKKEDKRASRDITEAKNAKSGSAKVIKLLVDKESLKEIQKISSAIRQYSKENTLPWAEDGQRLLMTSLFKEYEEKINSMIIERNKAIDSFVGNYQKIREQAIDDLGDMFNEMDYPDAYTIKDKFNISINYYPIPESDNYRMGLDSEDVKRIAKKAEDKQKEDISIAMKDVWRRLHKVINSMVERLSDPKNTFKDSLVNNVINLVDLLPHLNLTGDQKLEEMRKSIRTKIHAVDPYNLRHDPSFRKEKANEMKDLLKEIEQCFSPQKEELLYLMDKADEVLS
jgi:hypothetical protein